MKIRYYFEIDRSGRPIEGSNIKTNRPPKASNRWKEYTPQDVLCCTTDDDLLPLDPKGQARYWIQLDGLNKPISGSLRRKYTRPTHPHFIYQEVFPVDCCVCGLTAEDFTEAWTNTNPHTLSVADIITDSSAVSSSSGTILIANIGPLVSDNGLFTVVVTPVGTALVITVVSPSGSHSDTIPVTLTDGTCYTTVIITLAFTKA